MKTAPPTPEATYFLQRSIDLARTLPLPDAARYLRGLIKTCRPGVAVEEARLAYVQLSEADRRLTELQLALHLK